MPTYYTFNDCCTNEPFRVDGEILVFEYFDGGCFDDNCPEDMEGLVITTLYNECVQPCPPLAEGCFNLTTISSPPIDSTIIDWTIIVNFVSVSTCEKCQTCDTPQPPLPTPPPKFVNECEPITVINMEVSCIVVNPSSSVSNDGAASVSVSGGTPPYTIIWDNGNISPAIGNLSQGSYGATIVDYYGDFTAKTVCVLFGPTPTTTPTPTPTPTPISQQKYCMQLKIPENGKSEISSQIGTVSVIDTLVADSTINGKPSWISNSGSFRVYWNTSFSPPFWLISASTTPFYNIINYNSTVPPFLNPTNWIINGSPPDSAIDFTPGQCTPLPPAYGFELTPLSFEEPPNIELYVVKNNTICGCEGSIMANAKGGTAPYQYSIDGGISYRNFAIFDNLCAGIYNVKVKDDFGFTKDTNIEIDKPKDPTTYTINLIKTNTTPINNGTTLTKTYKCKVEVSPPLPINSTVTFDLVHSNVFNVSTTPESAVLITNTVLDKNGISIPYSNYATTTGTSTNTLNGCQENFIYVSGLTESWETLTFTYSDEIIINTTTTLIKNFITGCDFTNSEDNFYIDNVRITGCNCCNIRNITI